MMKMKLEMGILLGILVAAGGCGQNRGRSSGLKYELRADGPPILVENLATTEKNGAQKMQGFRILGTFARNTLPEDLSKAESFSAAGALSLEVETKSYFPHYETEVVPQTKRERLSAQHPVVFMSDPQNSDRVHLCIYSSPETEALFNQTENVTVLSGAERHCSKLKVPAHPRVEGHVKEQVLACDQNSNCPGHFITAGFPRYTVRNYLDIIRDIPGSKCIETGLIYRKSTLEQNVSRAIEAQVHLYFGFPKSGGKTLVFKL